MKELWRRARFSASERITRNWRPQALSNRAQSCLVSFSFDDFPVSAAAVGARILDDFSVRGTYFVSGSRAGQRVEGLDHFAEGDLAELANAGHEIGCHTFGHLRLPGASRNEIENDLARNKSFVDRVLGNYTMKSFAYPYGHASIGTKALLGRHFPICRGIWSGVNAGKIDFGQLRAVSLEQPFDPARISRILDEAIRCNGWVIFFSHDISDTPSRYGCRPEDLVRVVRDVIDRGIEILPIVGAAAKVRFSASRTERAVA